LEDVLSEVLDSSADAFSERVCFDGCKQNRSQKSYSKEIDDQSGKSVKRTSSIKLRKGQFHRSSDFEGIWFVWHLFHHKILRKIRRYVLVIVWLESIDQCGHKDE